MNTITDDLIAEIENEKLGKTIHHEGCMYYPAKMVERLIGEIRTLRADAARYRWLRADCVSSFDFDLNEPQLVFVVHVTGDWQDAIDDAIDTAILAERQK